MESICTKEFTVVLSQCDFSARLGVAQTVDLVMDLAGEHAEALGNGVPGMRERGLFWVAVKTKLRFYRRPVLGERCTVSTWPEQPGRMRCNRDYLLRAGDEVLAAGKTEWTILDGNTGGLHPMRDGVYAPDQVFSPERALDEPFHRFLGEFPDPPFAEYRVKSTDVDLVGHMNNVAYVRMLAGLWSVREREAMALRELELHYRTDCHEGDTLLLRRRAAEDGMELRAETPDGTVILLAHAVCAGPLPTETPANGGKKGPVAK